MGTGYKLKINQLTQVAARSWFWSYAKIMVWTAFTKQEIWKLAKLYQN